MENWRDREFMNVKQIGDALSISIRAAYDIVHGLPYVRVGRLIRVRTVHLEKYIRDQERRRAV